MCKEVDKQDGHDTMEASHPLVRSHMLVTDPPVLQVVGGRVGGHHVVEQRTDEGELEALRGEEVGEDDAEDGADVPAGKHCLQQLLYWRLACAGLALDHEGGGFVGRNLQEVAQTKQEVGGGDENEGHRVECCHDGLSQVSGLVTIKQSTD